MNSNKNTLARQFSSRLAQLPLRVILLVALILAIAPPAHAITKPVTVTITQLEQIGDDFDVTTLGDFYARVTINGAEHSTSNLDFTDPLQGYIVPTGNLLSSPWVLTEAVPFELDTVQVKIEILDSDWPDPNDQADINPGPKEVIDLEVDLSTGKWTGDVNWPQSCVSGPSDLSSDSAAICFDLSVLSANGDADGDGLLDGWELNGYNANDDNTIDVDLPEFGANALRTDMFVEADCLVASDHTHCPRQDSMADVVQSFANAPVSNPDGTTGVQLHIDVGSLYGAGTRTSVPGVGGVTAAYGDFGGGGNQITEAGNEMIDSFKSQKYIDLETDFFDFRQRGVIFRYAIFGHQQNNHCTSGSAPIPGFAFLVTLGGVRGSNTGTGPGDPCWKDVNGLKTGISVGSRDEQAGTFMHELGHTLGLHHDGGQADFNNEEVHFKPNYLSVMNYTFQWCNVPSMPGAGLPGKCDYSRIELPTLDETNLDECAGPDSGVYGLALVNWSGGAREGLTCPAPTDSNTVADANLDGVCIEAGSNKVLESIPAGDDFIKDTTIFDGGNRLCSTTAHGDDVQSTAVGATPPQANKLEGFEDWGTLQYSLLAIAGSGSGSGGTPAENEPDPETIRQAQEYMSEQLAPDVIVNKTGPATARPGDLLAYSVEVTNEGRGPALEAVLTDIAPDGSSQVSDLGAVVVGSLATRTSSFTVPLDACPGDFTSATASVNFKDFVGKELTASGSAPLEIRDVAPPIMTLSISPAILWPPNHKFVDVTATISVTDNCDPNPTVTLTSVVSNEPATGFLGNGDKGPDIQGTAIGTDDRAFSLRSERGTGGKSTGRVYTITYRVTDSSGNASNASATVTVPTNRSDFP